MRGSTGNKFMNRTQKIIYCFLLLFSSIKQKAQSNIQYGFGFLGGYKSSYQEQGAFLETRLFNSLDITFGYSKGKYNGQGFSTTSKYLILKNKIQPFIGVSYSKNFGNELNVDYKGIRGKYSISPNDFLCSDVGICYRHIAPRPHENNYDLIILIILDLNYRYAINTINCTYKEGTFSSEAKDAILKRAGNGLGVSLSLSFLIDKVEE